MKSNLDLVNDCDQLLDDPKSSQDFYLLKIAGHDSTFGYILKYIVDAFTWPSEWTVNHEQKVVLLSQSTAEARNETMNSLLLAERKRNTFTRLHHWSDELTPIYGPQHELVLSIERAAAPLFGVITYGVQLLAYHEKDGDLGIWIARRAMSKSTFPGMLDSTVGGSLRTGELPLDCVVREAEEEASFPPSLTRDLATSCGTLNYVNITDERGGGEVGLVRPEVQYLYEMQLPLDVKPKSGDNEVSEFTLFNVEQLKDELVRGHFTPANGCVVLDFFIRHGILTPENEPDYVEISSRLRRKLPFSTA